MSTAVIGSRYRLGSVVTCTPDATTWDARDMWLDERVLVVTPEPGCDARFTELAGALLDRSSAHFVGVYDFSATTDDFVVFGVPTSTLSDERAPREEEDVLVAGRALGDALEALHQRGLVHGDLHPGSVVVADSGDAALSPWPLAPRPQNWSGPGGFGSDPEERRDAAARDDVRALGAVLLGALAGPPVLSSEQIGNLEHELVGRAPTAVAIADRALTSPARGGYGVAAELRDDCAAALAGEPVADVADVADGTNGVSERPTTADVAAGAADHAERSEGRRAALVFAASGAALLAGIWFIGSGSLGAGARSAVRSSAKTKSGAAPARLADNSVSVVSPSSSPPMTTGSGALPSASSTTTAPPNTTTSSSPSTSTTTTAVSAASTTTTSTASTTTTTTPTATTTSSTSADQVQAGPNQIAGTNTGAGSVWGSGGGFEQGQGR